jgi:hypothetical protein
MRRLLLLGLLLGSLGAPSHEVGAAQTPEPRDPHSVTGCSNGTHPFAEVQDCACQVRVPARADACDKLPETRICATYCRTHHCHCAPICGDVEHAPPAGA